jgi:hypothetical protein
VETIGEQSIWSFRGDAPKTEPMSCTDIRKGPGHQVKSFMELATKVAELQFMNRDFVLLFRGQKQDHKNQQRNSSLKPSLFRGSAKVNPDSFELDSRFCHLEAVEEALVNSFVGLHHLGRERLERQRIIRWSIIQHYEISKTPLLDVTHSLRIAASFASDTKSDRAFIFALGVPHLSGAITASAEAGLQIVRLSSVCPPSAIRPHIQEGYLLGEYPDLASYGQKRLYPHYEIDFGRRLVGKFWFNPKRFWRKSGDFPRVTHNALYPNVNDPLYKVSQSLRKLFHTGS